MSTVPDTRPPAIPGVAEPAPDWLELKALTPARVALGRSGVSLPTREVLAFSLAHARARDAVHAALDVAALRRELEVDGFELVVVASAAADRAAYLARPDWGRRLARASQECIAALATTRAAAQSGCDVVLVLSDGLSARAVQRHAPPLLRALRPRLAALRLAPLVIATQARVALADEVGERLQARVAVSLIGERPGLSAPDSLGLYITAAPRVGRVDAERCCISNIHAAGLHPEDAAGRLAEQIELALRSGRTGVAAAQRPPALAQPDDLSCG